MSLYRLIQKIYITIKVILQIFKKLKIKPKSIMVYNFTSKNEKKIIIHHIILDSFIRTFM